MNTTVAEYFEHKNTILYRFRTSGINLVPGTLFIWNGGMYMNRDNGTWQKIERKISTSSSS